MLRVTSVAGVSNSVSHQDAYGNHMKPCSRNWQILALDSGKRFVDLVNSLKEK
jgi:hypothetical protein